MTSLARFEDIGFKSPLKSGSTALDPAPELNFSAAGATVRWASVTEWSHIVIETRAEEAICFGFFQDRRSALADCGLHRTHAQAARMAAAVAEMVLREPIDRMCARCNYES